MKQTALILLFLGLCLSSASSFAQDPLLDILGKELDREFSELKKQQTPVYFLSYRVEDQSTCAISGSFGTLNAVNRTKSRQQTPMLRVGSPELDNFHETKDPGFYVSSRSYSLPLENDPNAIAQSLWKCTNDLYYQSVQRLSQIKGRQSVDVPNEDKSPDFINGTAVKYVEPASKELVDKAQEEKLKDKVRLYSKAFAKSKDILNCQVVFYVVQRRDYFVSSDGSRIVENHPQVNLAVTGTVLADDGMNLPLYKIYYAIDLKNLPKDDVILADIDSLIKKLEALKKAPLVEPYTGPALLSGNAAGVFFHEIFGHRVEASRMKKENDAQTFKNKVGQQVLNPNLSVIFDPTIRNYKGFELSGTYAYDDEGTKSQRVNVVTKGILTDFLTNNTPIDGFLKSNGHGRAQDGARPVSRQSNMIVESEKVYSEKDLRQQFVAELKKQNLEFGFYFKEVSGGFTMTGRYQPNAFNVTPLEVYKVYVDGKPDELVRGINLVGTPLAMFSEIEAAGGDLGLFVGECGAESGRVPVSCVCPELFVKKIEIQKSQKSNNKKPILDCPL